MSVIAKAILRAVDVGRDITTTELFTAHFARGPARVVADAPRRLVVAGVTVASIGPDPSRINPMCATSAEDMPVVEMLSAIAAQHPTGVLVIESADAHDGFAFEIVGGKVTGARGPGSLGQLERWCAEVHRCYPDRFGTADRSDPLWIAVARAFVTERVLDHLELASSPGARLTFVRGDVTWNGTCLPEGKGISLAHLLLEHARRMDEVPRILARLGETSLLAVPLSVPPKKPTSPAKRTGTGGDGWDFFDDPDPAALEEWSDARLVWPLCDGQHSLEEIVELALLGRFRGLAALATLKDRNHILLGDAAPIAAVDLGEPEIGELENDLDQASALVVPLRRAATPAPIEPPVEQNTEYSVVLRTGAQRDAVPPPPVISSRPRSKTPRPVIVPRPAAIVPRPPVVAARPPALPTKTVVPQRPLPELPQRRAPIVLPAKRSRSRDVIDEMMAELETPSPDDEPAFATPPPAPAPVVVRSIEPKRGRSKATLVIAMVIAGATLFVAGAGVALQVSRTGAASIQR